MCLNYITHHTCTDYELLVKTISGRNTKSILNARLKYLSSDTVITVIQKYFREFYFAKSVNSRFCDVKISQLRHDLQCSYISIHVQQSERYLKVISPFPEDFIFESICEVSRQ